MTTAEIDEQFSQDNANPENLTEFDVTSGPSEDEETASTGGMVASSTDGTSKKRSTRTPEQRAAIAAAREAARAEAQRKREARQAERAARPPRHSVKLQRAAAALPQLTEDANGLYTDLIANLDNNQLLAVAAHVAHHVRATKTDLSRDLPKIAEGSLVNIVGTNADNMAFLGMQGTIVKPQSIHVIVDVDGEEVYLFRSDVVQAEVDSKETIIAPASNG